MTTLDPAIDAYVDQVVAAAPPFTPAELHKLAALIEPEPDRLAS